MKLLRRYVQISKTDKIKMNKKDKRTVDCEINSAFVINIYPAASYSPRPLPAKYHQRWRA